MNVSEVQLLLAAPAASGGYTTPGSVYNSNGRWCSTTQLSTTPLDNLFPDLTGPQNAALQVDYQCLFAYNSDPTDTMTNVQAWLPQAAVQTAAVGWAVGADSNGATPYNQAGAVQAGYISSPTIAPSTVTTWAAPSTTASGGVSLGSIPPGHVAALWIQRTATGYSVGPVTAGFNIQITFDVTG